MRNKSPVLLALFLTVSTALLSGCAMFSGLTGKHGRFDTPYEYKYDETHALPASQNIRIISEDAEVIVVGSDRDDVRIQAHYALSSTAEILQDFAYGVNVQSDGAELRVDEMRNGRPRNFLYDQSAHVIRLEVPRSAHVTIQEEDGSGTITSMAGSVEVTMDDGRVQATDCAGAITVFTDNGTFTQHNCTGSVTVQRR